MEWQFKCQVLVQEVELLIANIDYNIHRTIMRRRNKYGNHNGCTLVFLLQQIHVRDIFITVQRLGFTFSRWTNSNSTTRSNSDLRDLPKRADIETDVSFVDNENNEFNRCVALSFDSSVDPLCVVLAEHLLMLVRILSWCMI